MPWPGLNAKCGPLARLTIRTLCVPWTPAKSKAPSYLAMEYVEGVDLQKFVKDRGPMSVVNACKAIRQAALALASAHQAGLVHRDIKPSNLLVAKSGQIKLLDLGLARLAGDAAAAATELTTAGQTFGTPDYMAPEQWEDSHAADARTDLYALGCTLFFLLAGSAPFASETHRTAVNKMKGHLMDPIPDLAGSRADIPAAVVDIYQKLLAKKPADRFQTAAELAEALLPFSSTKSTKSSGTIPALTDVAQTEQLAAEPLPAISTTAPVVAQPKPATASGSGSRRNRAIRVASGAAAFFVFLGVIIITITSKDGTKTTLRVPEGTALDIQAAPDSTVEIKQAATPNTNPKPTEPVTSEPPANMPATSGVAPVTVDYAGERRAAEQALRYKAFELTLIDEQGAVITWDGKTLPTQPFQIQVLKLRSADNPILDDQALEPFAACKAIRTLHLQSRHVTATGLQRVLSGSALEWLDLWEMKLGRAELEAILTQRSPPRQTLQFGLCEFLPEDWDGLPAQAQVVSLSVSPAAPTPEQFRSLAAAMPALEFFRVHLSSDLPRESLQAFVESCPRLRLINVDRCEPDALLALQDGRAVNGLALPGTLLNESTIDLLTQLPALRTLRFTDWTSGAVATESLAALSRLTQLTDFGLYEYSPEVISAALPALSKLPSLQVLRLVKFAGTVSDYEHLSRFPALNHLAVYSIVHPAAPDEAFVARLKDWQTAHPWIGVHDGSRYRLSDGIEFAAERRAAAWLAEHLANGNFSWQSESGGGITHAQQRELPAENFAVRTITGELAPGVIDGDLAALEGCQCLTTVTLHGQNPRLTGRGLSWLGRNRGLSHLEIYHAPIIDRDLMQQLAGLNGLQTLRLVSCQGDPDAFRHCPRLPALTSLSLRGVSLLDSQLPNLAETFPQLTEINMEYGGGCPQSLMPLAGHPRLEQVSCSSGHLTPAGIAALQQLPRLRTIEVHSPVVDPPDRLQALAPLGDRLTKVMIRTWFDWDVGPSAADYDVLLSLPLLEEIHFGNHRGSPTDEHLLAAARLPRLHTLRIGFDPDQRKYTPAGIEAFRQRRPDVSLWVDGQDYPARPAAKPPASAP
jgi:serine/threonine protein kinase